MIILCMESNLCIFHILHKRLRVHPLFTGNKIKFQKSRKVSEGYMRLLHSPLFYVRMTRMHCISGRRAYILQA